MEDPNAMGGLDDMGMEDPNAMDGVGPDDDVVDITELTDAQEDMQQSQNDMRQSQEEIANQMSDVDEKLVTLLKVVDKFNSALEANDKKIADLKQELIKRTPTEEETMNVRLNAGGNPFAQKPNEFWEKFEDINNHYNITSNNKAPQFQIRKSDIDNFNEKMLDAEFDKIPQSLHEYFVK
jgi:chromosome segregation ATPase